MNTETPAAARPACPPERILIVDDEPRVLVALLRALGGRFRVLAATGPEEGLKAALTSGPFAVVVSDLKMPGMDGIEFLSRIQAISPHSVAMILTGHGQVKGANVFRWLAKPCPAAAMSQALSEAIGEYRRNLPREDAVQEIAR
jgi:DNA-binding NtrC family response regulator